MLNQGGPMSQTKSNLHSLRVRQRPDSETKVSTGANTEVFLDGQPLKGVTFLKFEFKAKKVTKVQLEMFTHVEDIEGVFVLGDLYPKIVSKSEPEDKNQQCAYIDFNDDPQFSIATNLLGQTMAALPPGTELVSINKMKRNDSKYARFVFRNELFKDGAEIVPQYQRNTSVVDGEVRTFDQFIGFAGDYLKK